MSIVAKALATHHYLDRESGLSAVKLLPCEYYVTRFMPSACITEPNQSIQQQSNTGVALLSTVLGSCVSACLRDPVAGIAGMNHFMLPQTSQALEAHHGLRYGNHAMAVLIESLERLGARREHLEAKVVGGGRIMSGSAARVGDANAEYVIGALKAYGIRVLARDLGGALARRVHYLPESGRMMVRRLGGNEGLERVRQQESRLIADLPVRELPGALREPACDMENRK